MHEIELQDIINATNGIAKNITKKTIDKVVINDKEVTKGCAFVAIIGDKFDGHQFLESALKKGASVLITNHEVKNFPQIIVKNTKRALLQIATLNRNIYKHKLIGITGSVGKTTTKEMLAQILSSLMPTLKTIGNLNNEIGVPKTLLSLNKTHKAAVVELGMSHLNEIATLSKACKPSAAIITNIGISHIEYLKSKENILRAKLEILQGMQEDSYIILNGDDSYLNNLNIKHYNTVLCGIENEKNTYTAKNIEELNFKTEFNLFKKGQFITKITINAPGKHNVLNSLLAIAAAIEVFNAPIDNICSALKNFVTPSMRQNIFKVNGITIISDCYNASPDSMKAAITTLNNTKCAGRKIAVLGNMLELGTMSEKAHFRVGEFVKNSNIDILYCYGKLAENILLGATQSPRKSLTTTQFSEKEELITHLKKILKPNDIILFKASLGENFKYIVNAVFNCF